MKTQRSRMLSAVVGFWLCVIAGSGYGATNTVFEHDLSTLDDLPIVSDGGGTWSTDGTNASFNGAGGSNYEERGPAGTFDFAPGGTPYVEVILVVTAKVDDTTGETVNDLFWVELKDDATESNKYARMTMVAGTAGPGLFFGAVGAGSQNEIGYTPPTTTPHTCRIVFDASGTELFIDGVSQGTTTETLDFANDYTLRFYGRDRASRTQKRLDHLLLTGVESDEPGISIDNVTGAEGDGGTSNFTFTVTLSKTHGDDVTFDFGTSDGTALAGSDYVADSDSLTIPAGNTSTTIVVAVTGDGTEEFDESFTVTLSNVVNALEAGVVGTGTILNDDWGDVILFQDDMSTMAAFTQTDYSGPGGTWWSADGTNTLYVNASSGAHHDEQTTSDTFDLNPDGKAYEAVKLKVTYQLDSLANPSADNDIFWIELVGTGQPTNALAQLKIVKRNDAEGLYLGDDAGNLTKEINYTPGFPSPQTCIVVFSADGAELFADGVSQGTTAETLDFTQDYKIRFYAKGDVSWTSKRLDDLILYAIEAPGRGTVISIR